MPNITLQDGKKLNFKNEVSGLEIAEKISKSLSKQALIMSVNGELKDLSFSIKKDSSVKIITQKDKEGLDVIRHDAAHIMAMAVQELFPGTQVTIGPVIENGFYYDFARKEPFTSDDLLKIEKKMSEIIDRDVKTKREVWERSRAISHFKKIGEKYKVSGAYWRGDSKNEMLQRIYGTCWSSKKDLEEYLHRLEEAEKRDHRKIGKEMDLFHFREESPGSVFWHEKGWNLFQRLIEYMRLKQRNAGYREINTPELLDKSLWEKSGHWDKFGELMFTSETPDEKVFAIKPMNCPGCVQVFKQGLKSYRDLPLKLSEFGKVHRYEPSGALHGLLRVRAFTQDDAHIFCTEEQITDECISVTKLILDIYKDLGFKKVFLKYSDRPEKRVGSDSIWDKSEKALLAAIKKTKLEYSINKGEGAFYGPKIEFVLRDAIGRDWQCGTLQVDLNLPERLGATYVDKNGSKKVPVMLHRALFGSLERFIGILIENYAGKLPFWLSPSQVVVLPIAEEHNEYAKKIFKELFKEGINCDVDLRNQKINYKIREHSLSKVPLLLICGKKEMKDKSITIRKLGSEKQETAKFIKALEKIKTLNNLPIK